MNKLEDYYKTEDGKKVYYFEGKLIGNEFQAVTFIVRKTRISVTNARKRVAKIKEFKGEDSAKV
jgi:hypothetical protein